MEKIVPIGAYSKEVFNLAIDNKRANGYVLIEACPLIEINGEKLYRAVFKREHDMI